MSDEQSHSGSSEPVTQPTTSTTDESAPPVAKPDVPRGFWVNPTEPLEKEFRPVPPSERKGKQRDSQ